MTTRRCVFRSLVPVILIGVGWSACAGAPPPSGQLVGGGGGPATRRDAPFPLESRRVFPLPESDATVRALAHHDGELWVASDRGVHVLDTAGGWRRPATSRAADAETLTGPAFALAVDATTIWIGTWNGLWSRSPASPHVQHVAEVDGPIGAVAVGSGGRVAAAGPDGSWLATRGLWERLDAPIPRSIRALAFAPAAARAPAPDLWFATEIGLYRWGATSGAVDVWRGPTDLASGDLRDLAWRSTRTGDELWIASNAGIDVYRAGTSPHARFARGALPHVDVRSLAIGDDGRVWAGAALGVARWSGPTSTDRTWSLRHSRRWLPDDDVRAVAVAADGTAWVATRTGVAAIATRSTTLAAKSDHFLDVVRTRHVRPPGLVERCRLGVPGDLSTHEPMDTDNDGLFTGAWVAAEAYRFAATGREDARTNAIAGFRALETLQTVTETPGFVARTVIPVDWSRFADANESMTPQEIAARRVDSPRWKHVPDRWRVSADGRWRWKGDTSSDEISGHFFAFGTFWDFVAPTLPQADRERVRAHVRRVADWIVDGDFVLRDLDGRATRWGVWSPAKLLEDPNWFPERGVNAVEILSFLTVAKHVVGDEPRYERKIASLLDEHGYRDVIVDPMPTDPASFTFIDAHLLALAYRGLFAYETDPGRLALYRRSLESWFAPLRATHSALFTFLYSAITGTDGGVDATLDRLRAVPLDMVQWRVEQYGRQDVAIVRRPQADRDQTDRLLPPDEVAVHRWDRNPYHAARGDDGRVESSSVYWLLGYWLARHHGFVAAPTP